MDNSDDDRFYRAGNSDLSSPCSPQNCTCCPRECGADRTSNELGYCHSGTGFLISSICAHHGEEPVLSGTHGICNIFFNHCNMQCIFCQNYQISDNTLGAVSDEMTLQEVVSRVEQVLSTGVRGVGFVSPSHFVRQVREIMNALAARGHHPVYVYNTNAYDKPETIRSLEKDIDVYLPDLKYADNRLAAEYSDTPDYWQVATEAVAEMYRQKGADIQLDSDDLVTSGLIIRHLVLPGHVENSKAVLRFIVEQLSPDVHISLMSQYCPTVRVADHPKLGRTLHPEEYREVLEEFERLGFHRGFIQESDSPHAYNPDFAKGHPFEH